MKLYQQSIHTTKQAYQAVHDFFSCYHPHEVLEEIDRLFKWAAKKHYYQKTAPADILFCVQQLQYLFSAVEIINYSLGQKMSVIVDSVDKLPIPSEYWKDNPHCNQWECIPRHLTMEEYLNPYWAFLKLNGIQKWQEVLFQLMESALSHASIDEYYTIREVMKWRSNFKKIVEAGWLVDVRQKN